MRRPEQADRITIIDEPSPGPFPPPGFLAFTEGDLGDGDTMGLYWPIGCESRQPLVVMLDHEAAVLLPVRASLGRWFELGGDEHEWGEPVDPDADAESPLGLHDQARERLRARDPDGALAPLQRAVAALPEYREALATLWGQQRRLGRNEEAFASALQALRSPPSFGPHPVQVLAWLVRQDEAPGAIANDPLWQARADLRLQFGGAKQNPSYAIFDAAIETYADQGRFVEALTLLQTHGELMSWETVSFQERHSWSSEDHARRYARLCTAGSLSRRRLEP